MKNIVIAPPAVEPVSLDKMRLHLGIIQATDTTRNAVITGRIIAARQWVEQQNGLALITQTIQATDTRFPACLIPLKIPLQSVTSVTYIDTDGQPQTLNPDQYQVDTPTGYLMPAYQMTWPGVRESFGAVKIEYVAGFGDADDAVPQAIKEAIMFIVGQWEVFQSSIEGVIRPFTIPNAAKELISGYIDMRECF